MTLGTVVLVGLLAALGVVALLAAVRFARTIRRGQELTRFQRAAAQLAADLRREGDPLVQDIEDLRRRSADASVAQARLMVATPALRALVARARDGLHPPPGLEALAIALAGETSRALRSAELAEVGLEALLDRRGLRTTEAATSLKRASLNLRNAIDEAGRLSRRIGELRPADLERPVAAVGAVATATHPTYGGSEDDLPLGS